MTYVYIKSEPELYTVGFYDPSGNFQPESDHSDPREAGDRVAYLNGGLQVAPGDVTQMTADPALRDMFATWAPTEIPYWFPRNEPPPALSGIDALKEQPGWDSLNEDQQRIAQDYVNSGWLSESPELNVIVSGAHKAISARNDERNAFAKIEDERCYFAWRWHYADKMLATRRVGPTC